MARRLKETDTVTMVGEYETPFRDAADEAWLAAKDRIKNAAAYAFPGSKVRFAKSGKDYLFFRVDAADSTVLTCKFRPTAPKIVNSMQPEQLVKWIQHLCRPRNAGGVPRKSAAA